MEELKTIMLVEDDTDILEIVKACLTVVGGFSVVLCTSGEEALQKVSEEQPQLILLDVMMPNMDGLTTLNKLKQIPEAAYIPVIFMTSKVQTHEIEGYKKMGVLDVISKPFDPMSLAKTVLDIWRNNSEKKSSR